MRRSVLYGLGVAIVLLLITGAFLYESWFGFGGIQSGDAVAPTLEADVSEQIIYRIDSTQSSVEYQVDEWFAGQSVSTAMGTTTEIAGDILLDTGNYANSQVGTIVINVEQFTSDSNLRDRRIRQEFLESELYPEATFVTTELVNFPDDITEDVSYSFQMIGHLTIKETTQSETWAVTATLSDDTLTGTATTSILMSDYDVGPIEIIGLVETSNEVTLTFEFVAMRVLETPETD